MTDTRIQLDHLLIPVKDRVAAARQLASILDVPWAEAGLGPFSPVYVNDGLTIDFDQADSSYPIQHYCFRVSEAEFDVILERLKRLEIPFRSAVFGPEDKQVDHFQGGRLVYWSSPDIHIWEMLTVSYERKPA